MKLLLFIFLFISSVCFLYSNELKEQTVSYYVSGTVYSEENSMPLRSVSVRVVDSQRGMMTNAKGEFKLLLQEGYHQIVFSMIGMERRIFEIDLNSDTSNIEIVLKTSSALIEGVVVIAEDPGKRLMRKAIKRKMQQNDSLESYKYLLYTKFVASTDTLTAGRTVNPMDTTIVSIFESFSEGYFKKPNKYYNEIIQRKQSVNIPPQANFVVFGTNLNVYDDFVKILGEDIYSPFHPDAPDFYDFILDTNYYGDNCPRGGRIIVTPDSKQRRLFSGYINLDPETLVPICVELYPNEVVRLPFNTKLKYKQDFKLIDDKYLMPNQMSIVSTSNASIFGLINPRLDITIDTYASNFEINLPIADKIFYSRMVEARKNADVFDEEFWKQNRMIELSDFELQAYDAIRMAQEAPDSAAGTSFFDIYFEPINRQLRKLNRKPFTGIEDMFVFNRVQGVYLGPSVRDMIGDYVEYQGKLGYAFADKRINYDIGFKFFFDEMQQYALTFDYENTLTRSDNPFLIRKQFITLTSLVTGNDYGDYYYAHAAEVSLSAGFGQLRFIRRGVFERPFQYKVYFKTDNQKSADLNSRFSLFGRTQPRENPVIIDGLMNTIGFDINWNFNRARRLSNFGFYLGAEYSHPEIFGSDFDFSRFQFMMNIRTKTLPLWRLDLRLNSGYSFGNVPPQRFFTLESSTSILSANTSMRGMKAKEFYGDQYVVLSMEHSFGEIIPGMIRIPNIAEFGIEFITYGNAAFSKFSQNAIYAIDRNGEKIIPATTWATGDKYYYEVGLGLNRLFIFLRTDLSIRLSQVSTPRFFFTITNASF